MNDNRIFALGFFDGVHLGHQTLLAACTDMAAMHGAAPAAITFLQHPQSLFQQNPPAMINSDADRARLLRQYGIDCIYKFPVTKEVMSTHWQSFLELLMQYGAVGFVCGYDFRFGCRGEGTAEKLQQFCNARQLPCLIIPEQTLDGMRISSTHIRRLIEAGDMESANRFLGHPHLLSGIVTHGRHLGRTIGVPTANILIPPGVTVPKLGVYACKCTVNGKEFTAVTNVGSRPTVHGHQIRTESWILDFDGDLYGSEITLAFYKFLRPEEKFDSLAALQAQIRQDAEAAKRIPLH